MGIMLVYDITDGKSFDSIGKWLRNIDEVAKKLKTFFYLKLSSRNVTFKKK